MGGNRKGRCAACSTTSIPPSPSEPGELVVYGGTGKAARDHECLEAIVGALKNLGDDETLIVQSGKPVAVLPTHPDAPRVLIIARCSCPLGPRRRTSGPSRPPG